MLSNDKNEEWKEILIKEVSEIVRKSLKKAEELDESLETKMMEMGSTVGKKVFQEIFQHQETATPSKKKHLLAPPTPDSSMDFEEFSVPVMKTPCKKMRNMSRFERQTPKEKRLRAKK